ncbi:hypothetical protein E6O75_ATG02426 [Venturia nashicola]|uniref:Rhodopsin domain-containing protein n=1 Tax=Venturia nashicola TaxID=86259 RepID=A0A4Z1PFE7_9PEZI|nr:hypothetical protein E6O75_ATG02426 [Venturia nashicola]
MVGWDDWIMLTATVFFTVYCASVIDISTRVTSTHQIVSYNDLLLSVNLLNVAEVFYILSIMTLKIALAVFFLRLTVALWQRRVVLVTLAVSSSFSVLMFFFLVFQCGVYDNSTVFLLRRISNQCASNDFTLGMAYTHAILTTLTDWAFLVLPYFILKGSLMNQNEKRSVILILMFASVYVMSISSLEMSLLIRFSGGIASIVRFKFIHGLAIPGDEFFGKRESPSIACIASNLIRTCEFAVQYPGVPILTQNTANARDIGIWSCLEPGIGIIAGSIVTLRPLIRRLVFLFKNSSYSSSRFPRQRSRPTLYKTPSSAPLQQSQHHEADSIFLQHQTSVHEMGIVEEKEVAKTETSKDSPFARRSSSGLPLYLFGSLRSKTSSRRTKSTKSSASMFSRFSIAPTIPDMTSFIWREATDETDEGSTKDSERDYDKNEEGGDPRTGPSTTWLEQDIKRGDLGTGLSPTSEEQQDWLEAQLSLEQLRPTKNEHERRFSQEPSLAIKLRVSIV